MSILKYLDPQTGELKRLLVPIKVIQNVVTEGGTVNAAPSDIVLEAERVAGSIISKGEGLFRFVIGSDFHRITASDTTNTTVLAIGQKSTLNAGQGMQIVASKTGAKLAVRLGDDTFGSKTTTIKDGVESITDVNRFTYVDGIENIRVPGNHDPLNYSSAQNGELLSAEVLEGLIGDYRYVDFENEKIRFIALNTAEVEGGTFSQSSGIERISGTQLQWFCNALDLSAKSNASEWGIVVFSHHPADWGNIKPVANVIAAYIGGGTYSATHEGTSVSYNFSGKNAAEFMANIHGHTHCFKVAYISGTEKPRIAIPNAYFYRNNEYGEGGNTEFGETTTYNKVDNGTGKNTAFCAVAIDKEEKIIYLDCFGAGYDRIVSYGAEEVITYTVSNSLSYAKTNNGSTIAVGGGSYSAIITAETGYTLNGATVSVKMGGVDITSTAYSNGVINIAEVTGDIVITVAAVVDPDYEATKYTITNSLANVTNLNSTSEVEEGAEYSATIKAASGYQLDSVVITMGGKNITSTAYSGSLYNGNITISSVTGNVVITAAAVQPSYTNLVPTSEAADSTSAYNETGYKDGVYCSSSGGDSSDSACVSTGYIPFSGKWMADNAIYVKGAAVTTTSHVRIYGYTSKGSAPSNSAICTGSNLSTYFTVEELESGNYYKLTFKTNVAQVVYLRLSLIGTGANLVVTYNEPIE